MRTRIGEWSWSSAAVMLTSLTLLGCNGSDLSGYRPLEKNGTTKSDKPESVADVNVKTDQELTDATPAQDVLVPSGLDEPLPVSALVPVNVVDGVDVSTLLKVVPDEVASALSPSNADVQVASASSVVSQKPVTTEPRKVEVLIPEKIFRTDATSRALRVSYDDLDLLKVINMEPVTSDAVEQMPEWLRGLNGKRIKIRGFMYPTFETEGIERFVLARDNQICCFGRDPKVYDLVQVDMKAGKTTNYIPATRAFDVVGQLKIEMISEDGKPFGLYFLEGAEVIDR